MYRYFHLIAVLYIASLVTGCDYPAIREKQNGVFYINNNQLEPLEFKIDNTKFVMGKGEVKKLNLIMANIYLLIVKVNKVYLWFILETEEE